ncbi:MAG TPA: hypothetical protein V6C58_26410 [Allocoleopsis sp.]
MSKGSIVAVKLANGTTILAELEDDAPQYLVLRDAMALKEMLFETSSGYSVLNIPHLYFFHNNSGLTNIPKHHILAYDLADDYTIFYYESTVDALIDNEMNKRKMVFQMYDGKQESQLQWDDELPEEPKKTSVSVASFVDSLDNDGDDSFELNFDYDEEDEEFESPAKEKRTYH